MKTSFTFFLFCCLLLPGITHAQRACSSFSYHQRELQKDPSVATNMEAIEAFTRQYTSDRNNIAAREQQGTIFKIPVVVHILFHYPEEQFAVSDEQVAKQIDILNKNFRRMNADTNLTPSYFKPLAADCEIEFQLAISDPSRKNTNGIIRKYSPIAEWEDNDDVKFSSRMGDDAWDSKSYLNIWVCNMRRVAGYATMPGGDVSKDGVVISYNVFGPTSSVAGLDQGKTAVHEVGHWLNLRHLWGDDYCGDDNVHDTPVQGGYNYGCPSGKHITCNNGPNGDMFMNYMDFTNDACLNMFTKGQKTRMWALFASGGARQSLLLSKGLQQPLYFESPLPVEQPRWLHPQLYPNPASGQATLDLSYDPRWLGKTVSILNMQGEQVMRVNITSRTQVINMARLAAGMYILSAKKEDGDFILLKFIKQ
jgi:hypothetical protein